MLAIALLALVVALGDAPASARKSRVRDDGKPRISAKEKRVEAKKKARKKRAREKARRARKAKGAGGIKVSNMPRGWAWPPSPQMVQAGDGCLARLDELGLEWKPGPAQDKVATPIVLPAMTLPAGDGTIQLVSTYRKAPFVMDCQLAVGLADFAEELYDVGVREIHFSRIYDYTEVRVNGVTKHALSRHALGIAIDMRAFVDDTGRKAVVVDDYPLGDPLLIAVEQALSSAGDFRTVLTPRNDPASHSDHFHVEVEVDYQHPMHASTR